MRNSGIRQRVQRVLDDGEVLVASLTGIEADGRRRRFVALTGRRLLVGWMRPAPVDELDLADVVGEYDRRGHLLTLRTDEVAVVLRSVDEHAARALLDLLAHRQPSRGAEDGMHPRLRLVDPAS